MSAWRFFMRAKCRQYTAKVLLQDNTILPTTSPSHTTFSIHSFTTYCFTLSSSSSLPLSSSSQYLLYGRSIRQQLHDSLHSQIHRTHATQATSSPTVHCNIGQGKDKPVQISRFSAAAYTRHEKTVDWKQVNRSTTRPPQLQQFQLILPEEIKDGRIECNLLTARRLMAIGATLKAVPNPSVIDDICREHNVPTRVASQVASLLLKASNSELQQNASRLLRGAANAGDPYAILFLCGNAVHHNRLNLASFLSLQNKLNHLAQYDSIPQAVYLTGRIAQLKGKRREATEIYKRCLSLLAMTVKMTTSHDLSTSGKEFAAYERAINSSGAMSHPSVQLAGLCMEDNDMNGALDACRLGAFKYDDPDAYYLLALGLQRREPYNSDRWLPFLIKAAASGVSHAAHLLGIYYAASASTSTERLTLENLDPDNHQNISKKDNVSNSSENNPQNPQNPQAELPTLPNSMPVQSIAKAPSPPPPPPQQLQKITHSQRKQLLLAEHWLSIAVTQDRLASNLALARVLWELGDKKIAASMLEKNLVGNVDAVRTCPGAMKAARELLPKWKKEVSRLGLGSGSGGSATASRLTSNIGSDGGGMMSRIRDIWPF